MTLTGDSDEYWFLTEAIELSKDVQGICCEIGIRLGLGTKTIIDAVRQYCPEKMVVSIDPFGNIPYTGREPYGATHYDYTDSMRNDCMADLWEYLRTNPVDYRFFNLSDEHFFQFFANGIPKYDYTGWSVETQYAMAHLDGPHTVIHVSNEITWFNERMDSGATIVIDDITPDFMEIKPIQELFTQLGWTEIKLGGKKGIWQKQ